MGNETISTVCVETLFFFYKKGMECLKATTLCKSMMMSQTRNGGVEPFDT